ncbi:TetR/AcrR family transcriptional regulator [Defluviimonas sp. WL0024]|uniref:TetR/AcrR family transcriptional regulator n=3 Tax=Albidovulum TaxID=205889 RepID=A0ABT3J749_9RHOB|nr:TetR/AcrR family transcriptional regulator [Defluviimonas sp. WL0024]MCU9847290.1 TetR/AcrR family transcriptional regulator [Defluviimonas sp. WL0024]MCW3783511.1 TetR/AcrR family transcriptional regulator [Defluviimonas salinarum]
MEDMESLGRGWRGTEAGWIEAAYQLLIEGGVEAVKILPLARRLRLSRTSFYWHFTDRESLLAALVKRWQEKNTGNLVLQTEIAAATINEAVLNLFDCWVTPELFDAALDVAMRNWARTDSDLGRAFEAADNTRLAAIRAMFQRHGYGAEEADIRANTVYLTQVGYLALGTAETLETRLQRIPTYLLTFTGRPGSAAELETFNARHRARIES